MTFLYRLRCVKEDLFEYSNQYKFNNVTAIKIKRSLLIKKHFGQKSAFSRIVECIILTDGTVLIVTLVILKNRYGQ